MKNPNGFGTVYKLSGKRRNPWVACKTKTWSYDGQKAKQERIIIGYYPTKKDALEALANYNATMPHATRKMTFKACLDAWKKEHLPKVKESTQRTYTTAINRCYPIYNKYMSELTLSMLQEVVDTAPTTAARRGIKLVVCGAFDWAIRHEVLDPSRKQYAYYISINGDDRKYKIERIPFAREEIVKLWAYHEATNSVISRAVLVLLYTGMRLSELLNMSIENVDVTSQKLRIVDAKTEAGIRDVPIPHRIAKEIQALSNQSRGYLLTPSRGRKYCDTQFRREWKKLMNTLGMEHRPHDTRHTYITELVEHGIDARLLKSIVGHANESVTDIYTHISFARKLAVLDDFDYR